MKFYIMCDNDGVLKAIPENEPDSVLDLEEESLEVARALILKEHDEIEKGTVYGPFEHSYHTREKGGLY